MTDKFAYSLSKSIFGLSESYKFFPFATCKCV